MSCRIWLEEGGTFVHPCSCKGEVGNVHPACVVDSALFTWVVTIPPIQILHLFSWVSHT